MSEAMESGEYGVLLAVLRSERQRWYDLRSYANERLDADLHAAMDAASRRYGERARMGDMDKFENLLALTDDVVLDLGESSGPKCDERKLRKLPPWRAYDLAIVAVRCGALPQDRADAILAECREVGGDGQLRPEP